MLTISMSGMAQEIYLEIKMDVYAGNIKYRSEDNIVGEEADLGRSEKYFNSSEFSDYRTYICEVIFGYK